MKPAIKLLLLCLCIAGGWSVNGQQSHDLALQYAKLKSPVEKAVFCLTNTAFFLSAPSDNELNLIFGDDAQLPSVTTNEVFAVRGTDKERKVTLETRTVRLWLRDRRIRPGPPVQLPPPWECVARYRSGQLVSLHVQSYQESK